MAKTRAQRKAERRAREAEERKRSDGERGAESRAQHDTQVPVSGDIAEIEADGGRDRRRRLRGPARDPGRAEAALGTAAPKRRR